MKASHSLPLSRQTQKKATLSNAAPLELDDTERVGGYLRQTLAAASRMMTDLLEEQYDEHDDRALVRSAPASLDAGHATGG